ncbi:MAG: hypothetical protein ACE5IY_05585 [bacterium]
MVHPPTDPQSPARPAAPKHAEFQIRFIWWALGLAIFAGFALGAHVASVIGFEFPLHKGFYPYIQTHGHVQLLGWAGLFIMGVSLHFIPRLAGTPLSSPSRLTLILRFMVSALVLKFSSQSLLPYITQTAWFAPLSVCAAAASVLLWMGVVIYVGTVFQTARGAPDLGDRRAFRQVLPFFAMMTLGWLTYATLNLGLVLKMVVATHVVLDQGWSELATQLFLNLVLLPVAFAFSVRLFPLYLRLPLIDWPVGRVAVVYFCAVCVQLVPTLPPVLTVDTHLPGLLSCVGRIVKGCVILFFAFKLDVLTRRRAPWTVHRELHPGPERRQTRNGLPDYGEFGRFEWLVYSAYVWLIFAAVLEIASALFSVLDVDLVISTDAVRHAYLMGFITHLIMGVAVRMIPGFLGKKKIARPALVLATFWLGNLALGSRVFPLVIPAALIERVPGGLVASQIAFGLSGGLAIAAVVCLATNLVATARK